MIQKRKQIDGYEVFCDVCSYSEEFEDIGFHDLIGRIKDEGWLVRKRSVVWEHLDPDCARERGRGRRLSITPEEDAMLDKLRASRKRMKDLGYVTYRIDPGG